VARRLFERTGSQSRGCVVVEAMYRVTGDLLAVHVAPREGDHWLTRILPMGSADAIRVLETVGVFA
jgi:hypothetical protein